MDWRLFMGILMFTFFGGCAEKETVDSRTKSAEEAEFDVQAMSDEDLLALVEGATTSLALTDELMGDVDLDEIVKAIDGEATFIRDVGPKPDDNGGEIPKHYRIVGMKVDQSVFSTIPNREHFRYRNYVLGAFCLGQGCQFRSFLPRWTYGDPRDYLGRRWRLGGYSKFVRLHRDYAIPFMPHGFYLASPEIPMCQLRVGGIWGYRACSAGVWVRGSGSCSRVCSAVGLVSQPSPEGSFCVSALARPETALGIVGFPNGCYRTTFRAKRGRGILTYHRSSCHSNATMSVQKSGGYCVRGERTLFERNRYTRTLGCHCGPL